ncbi:MAG: thiopurine S-methyltransferase [Kofleriaceae bacterium]
MEAEFWKQRWAEGRIGFHEGAANDFLVTHGAHLAGRVLVPMCGKAEDLAYLASRGHEVIGVELVEDAVAAFFSEHGIVPAVDEPWGSTHRKYTHGTITIIAGDWFSVTRDMIGTVDSVYDRAAIVAMPPAMRAAYITKVRELVALGTPGLLVTISYPPGTFEGPPFSVEDADVGVHFAQAERLDERILGTGPLATANTGALERCYAITI